MVYIGKLAKQRKTDAGLASAFARTMAACCSSGLSYLAVPGRHGIRACESYLMWAANLHSSGATDD